MTPICKHGDVVLLHTRMKKGEETRAARITHVVRLGDCWRIAYEPAYRYGSEHGVLTSGTGTDVLRDQPGQWGLQRLEVVGHEADWPRPTQGWMKGHPGYDLMH